MAPRRAINGVNLRIGAGELVVVVGPNGAGKSTLINAIGGVHRYAGGDWRIDGRHHAAVPPHRFCDHGIAIVPEGRRLFTTLTVRENLELGSYRGGRAPRRAQSLAECADVPGAGRSSTHPPERSPAASSRWWRSAGR